MSVLISERAPQPRALAPLRLRTAHVDPPFHKISRREPTAVVIVDERNLRIELRRAVPTRAL